MPEVGPDDDTDTETEVASPVASLSTYAQRQELTVAHYANELVEEDFYVVVSSSNEVTLRVLLLVVGVLLILVSFLMLVNVYVNRKNRNMY